MEAATQSETSKFCALQTLVNKEPIWGTARRFSQFIFILWPKSDWTAKPLAPASMPSDISRILTHINKESGTAVRLVNCLKTRLPPNQLRVMWQTPGRTLAYEDDIKLADLPDLASAIAEQQEDPASWQHLPGRHLFICCHAKKDKCCAKFGFRSAQTLRAYLDPMNENPACGLHHDWHVYETTHLVGDRFAGNALVMPQGHCLGRLRAKKP